MGRIGTKALYIEVSQLIGKRSFCRRAQIGCVITQNDRIISTGYNGKIHTKDNDPCKRCDPNKPCDDSVIHAEVNAIYAAAKEGISLDGAVLYCVYSPCMKCAQAILQSGIKEVWYLTEYRNSEPIAWLRQHNIIVDCVSDLA